MYSLDPIKYAEMQGITLNYIGELYLVGANQTPLLSMMGGLAGGGGKTCRGFTFACAQPWNLDAANQDTVSEDTAAAGPTLRTYTRGQDTNTIQIMHEAYGASYAKQSTYGEVGAITNVAGDSAAGNPVTNEVAFQRTASLRQLAINIEFSFLQGSETTVTDSSTNTKTQGFANAIATNTIAAGGAALSKSLMNQLFRTMVAAGAPFINTVIFVNAFQKQQITDIYGYAPEDRNVGGMNIKQIETDFGMVGIVYDPFMLTDDLYAIEMSVIAPMYCPKDGMIMIDEPLAKTGALDSNQLYLQIGLDFGFEEAHGSLTGLSTS